MTTIQNIYEQLKQTLSKKYTVILDEDSILIITPYVNYIHDCINVCVTVDKTKIIIDDDNDTNNEFMMGLAGYTHHNVMSKLYNFQKDEITQNIIANYNLKINQKQTLYATIDISSDISLITERINDVTVTQYAMMTYLMTLQNQMNKLYKFY